MTRFSKKKKLNKIHMRTIKDTCIDFFTDEHMKQDVREMMKPIFRMIYNEVYLYIWIIAFYHIFIIFLMLSMFIILWRLMRNYEWKSKMMTNLFI
jgi:hypothetical protein